MRDKGREKERGGCVGGVERQRKRERERCVCVWGGGG